VKKRADLLLFERGLCTSRTQAQALLLSGRVFVGEQRIDKAGTLLSADVELTVRQGLRFVSRGGEKLAGALDDFGFDPTGMVFVDIGASTGGFTDCLLQRGARLVYAVDVGHGQLAQRLREDPRVVSREGENARFLGPESFAESIDGIVVDASFISLATLLPACARILPGSGSLLALVKPQFEVGREEASRHAGVIRDPELRKAAIGQVREALEAAGFGVVGGADSHLKGPKGNLEHFLYARRR
jgi:23S rRNA (cytidine1920-2'-O)/16S rRNA (cytidine1409-2'-O)-methyltransferase